MIKYGATLIIDGFSLEAALNKRKKYTIDTFPYNQLVNFMGEKTQGLKVDHKHFIHCFPRKGSPKTEAFNHKLSGMSFQTYSAMKVYGANNTQPSLIKAKIVGAGAIMATILSIELLDHLHPTIFILTSDIATASAIYILNRKKKRNQKIVLLENSCISKVPALKKVCDGQLKINLPM